MKKLARLTKNILVSNFCELSMPFRITYIVTSRCQLKCTMCSIWKKPSENELTLGEINTFFKNTNHFSWINLSGGEIFLRNDVLDIIDIIDRRCRSLYLLDFPTNGYLSDTIVESIQTIRSRYTIPKLVVTVSIDGPPGLHDTIRGVPGSWKKAVATFKRLRGLQNKRFTVFLGFTLQPTNMNSFDETFDALKSEIKSLRYNDFHVNIIQYSPHYYCNSQSPQPGETDKLWASLSHIMTLRKTNPCNPIAFLERKYQTLANVYLKTHKTPLPCQALCASCFMDPQGSIYPCSIYDRPIANIRDFDYDLRKVWKNTVRKQLRKEIKAGQCPQCWTPCEAYQTILAHMLPAAMKRYP